MALLVTQNEVKCGDQVFSYVLVPAVRSVLHVPCNKIIGATNGYDFRLVAPTENTERV